MGAVRAAFIPGTDSGTHGPRVTQSHTKSCDIGSLGRGHTHISRLWASHDPSPTSPSTHPSHQADPLPSSPLSLALQQSSCSKLIEFSAWEGPGEVRRGGGWEEACSQVWPSPSHPCSYTRPPTPLPSPPLRAAGNNGQAERTRQPPPWAQPEWMIPDRAGSPA